MPEPRVYLVEPGHDLASVVQTCPHSQVMTAWSQAHESRIVISLRCKQWSCPHCGRRRIAALAKRAETARPTRFVTLTVRADDGTYPLGPRQAYDATRGCVTRLATRLRRRLGEWEYLRVLEATRRGWPHYHLLVRSPYIAQRELSQTWASLTQAPIVDIRRIRQIKHTYRYLAKYLAKQRYVPWTHRRVSWSRDFFPPQDFRPPDFGLIDFERHAMHLSTWLYHLGSRVELTQVGSDAWLYRQRTL